MSRYCKTYKIICTCVSCHNSCNRSAKTRAEAEVTRGVKLDVDGHVLGSSDPHSDSGAKGATDTFVSIPPAGGPLMAGDDRGPGREGVLVALGAVFLAVLVGSVAVAYILINLAQPEAAGDNNLDRVTAQQVEMARAVEKAKAQATPAPTPAPDPTPAAPDPADAEVADAEVAAADATPEPTPRPQATISQARRIAEEELARLEALKQEGNNLVASGDFPAARQIFEQAIIENPDFFEAHNNLANTWADEGNYRKAEPIYRRALETDPNNQTLRFNMGNNYVRAERWDLALPELNKATQLDPDDAEAHLLKGVTHYKLGDMFSASAAFHRAAVLDPTYAEAFYNLAVIYTRLGYAEEAQRYLSRARSLDPGMVRMAQRGG